MAVLRKTWKKVSFTILTALGLGTLTSCYGMPPSYYPPELEEDLELASESEAESDSNYSDKSEINTSENE